MKDGYYYNIIEAGEFIDKIRRGINPGKMKVYQFDKMPNGYWPIYEGRSNKFLDTEEQSREEIESYLGSRA